MKPGTMTITKLALAAALSTMIGATFAAAAPAAEKPENECIAGEKDIADQLKCLDGVKSREVSEPVGLPAGIRHFELKFTQPVDHKNPNEGTFEQRVVLLHRSENEPVILQTSGYSIFGVQEAAITRVFKTNQVQVEHRHFKDSVPNPVSWEYLDIEQSANDFHEITVALKKIYHSPWVNTGASKGGMTSVYHRWFFPDDLNGTVADVAPLSFSTSDERYITFIENVGGDKWRDCRQKLETMQANLLAHHDQLVPRLKGDFSFLNGSGVAFEHAVIEASFAFWQYSNPEARGTGCADIPAKANPEKQLAFLQAINSLSNYENASLLEFLPYYYQAASQLGNPGSSTAHLDALRKYDFNIDQYAPKDASYNYSNTAMRKLEQWIKTDAESIMFVYGELDPWTAGAFPKGRSDLDNHHFLVPGGNHGAKFTMLPSEQKARAIEVLARWLRKKPSSGALLSEIKGTLDELEFKVRRRRL